MYIPPVTSSHNENDFLILENEIFDFSCKGKIVLLGDFNSRTGEKTDYIENDSMDLNRLDNENLLPEDYQIDYCSHRNSQDSIANGQGENLLDLCVSSRLRMLNGRYLGDILGNYTCITYNGFSVVDYAIVSEGLLPSVKYFQTHDFNYLSDHAKIELYLRCNCNIFESNIFANENWSKSYTYKWDTENSKQKLLDCFSEEKMINDILKFETETFSDDQSGVDGATSELTNILKHLSDKSCKIKKGPFKQVKKHKKQIWSDQSILDLKHEINALGKTIRSNPFNAVSKIRYFKLIKMLKKATKQKKAQFKQNIFRMLEISSCEQKYTFIKCLKFHN